MNLQHVIVLVMVSSWMVVEAIPKKNAKAKKGMTPIVTLSIDTSEPTIHSTNAHLHVNTTTTKLTTHSTTPNSSTSTNRTTHTTKSTTPSTSATSTTHSTKPTTPSASATSTTHTTKPTTPSTSATSTTHTTKPTTPSAIATSTTHTTKPTTPSASATSTTHTTKPTTPSASATSTTHTTKPTTPSASATSTKHTTKPTTPSASATSTTHTAKPTTDSASATSTKHTTKPTTPSASATSTTHTAKPTTDSASTNLTTNTTKPTTDSASTNLTTHTTKPTTHSASVTPTTPTTRSTNASHTTQNLMHQTTENSWPTEPSIPEGILIISEVYFKLESDSSNDTEFMELYGDANMDLSNYTVVLFGGSEMKVKLILSLTNYSTNSNGSFVIAVGNSDAMENVDMSISNSLFSKPVTMAAIYGLDKPSLTFGLTKPTKVGLLDYVLYGTEDILPRSVKEFSPNINVIKKTSDQQESVSRCFSAEPRDQRAFTVTMATPGLPNDCRKLDLIISEVRYGNSCFIELHSMINASMSLNSYVLVVYSTNTSAATSNKTFDLWNMRTNTDGYFMVEGVLGSASPSEDRVLHCRRDLAKGTTAVILYQITMEKTLRGLLPKQYIKQQMVFNTSSQPLDRDLVSVFMERELPSYTYSLHGNAEDFLIGNHSLSQCGGSYVLLPPTPDEENECPVVMTTEGVASTSQASLEPTSPSMTTAQSHKQDAKRVFINEITLSESSVFIEIRGDANGDVRSYYIEVFDGCSGDVFNEMPLNQTLSDNGFLQLDSDFDFKKYLTDGSMIAIGLYQHKPSSIQKTTDLIDAVAMAMPNYNQCSQSPMAHFILAEKSKVIVINHFKSGMSLSRCSTTRKKHSEDFAITKPSPGNTNYACPQPDINPPSSSHKSKSKVEVTLIAVAACLSAFLVLVIVAVIMMKRKKKGVLQFHLARLDEDDDEELITNMEPIEDLNISGSEATFRINNSPKLKVTHEDDESLVRI